MSNVHMYGNILLEILWVKSFVSNVLFDLKLA